jgi:ubiquitin C-terminal hydrolase
MMEQTLRISEEVPNREAKNYILHISYLPHEQSQSAVMLFVFQNGEGLSSEELREEVIRLENNLEGFDESGNVNGVTNGVTNGLEVEGAENKLTFDISITVNIVDYKNATFNFKDIEYGKILKFVIPINTYFYQQTDDVVIVTELVVRKNYNIDVKFTGIINEAMTCYMNSMLQILNCLGYFKKALFKIPVLNHEDISYNLQRFFYDLSTPRNPISTNKLIKSFGWSREQIFEQHDIQEFNMLLSDVMESKMKGTESEDTFKFLFEGKSYSYIKCINVEYESSREETFSDLQLTVRGLRDINESLAKYTEEETLDGEDQYDAGNFGKQAAKIGKKFVHFPNVLIAQLKRFEYNPRKDMMDKINDYFEFYDEINIKPYMRSVEVDDEEYYKYTLHSVVVHRGNVHGGHYFAYIRPSVEDKWYLYNDEKVREADKFEVFNLNYGGPNKMYKHKDKGLIIDFVSRLEANAYILIYIRNTLREKILSSISEEDIPQDLKNLIEEDKEKERKQEMERQRKIRNMNVFILTRETLKEYDGLGLTPPLLNVWKDETILLNDRFRFKINIPKDTTINQLIQYVTHNTKIPASNLAVSLYVLESPHKLLQRNSFKAYALGTRLYDKTMNDIQQFGIMGMFKHVILYIDIITFNNELNILENNENPEEGENESSIQDDEGEDKIFYFEKDQYFKFKSNDYIPVSYNEEDEKIFNMAIFKYYNEAKKKLVIDDIVLIPQKSENFDFNSVVPFQERCKKYSLTAPNELTKVNLYMEKTSFNKHDYSKNLKETNEEYGLTPTADDSDLEDTNNLLKIGDLNELREYFRHLTSNCIIINVEFQHGSEESNIMETVTDNLFNTVYLKLGYIDNLIGNDLQVEIDEKLEFSLVESDEGVMRRVYSYARKFKDFNSLFQSKYLLYFLAPEDEKLRTLEHFLSELDSEQVYIMKNNTKSGLNKEDMPLYKYIQTPNRDPEVFFQFTLKNMNAPCYEDSDYSDNNTNYIPFGITFFDIENNPICRLVTYVNTNADNACIDVVENLYEIAIREIYPKNTPSQDSFFFILQHTSSFFAYEIFTRRHDNLLKYINNNLSIEYRLQPFTEEEYTSFTDIGYSKLFIAFCTRDYKPACDPMIIHVKKDSKVIDVKKYIFEKIEKIKKLKNFEFTFQKLKFYTYSLVDYKPIKEILLLPSKDEELLFHYCKHNLLVEFPSDLPTNNNAIILF